MGFIPWGNLLSRQHRSVFRVAPRQCQSSHWYTFLGESIVVLQADEKATVRKMGEVFPLLVDLIQAAGAVGAQMQPCLEKGAGPAGPGDSWTQLCTPYHGTFRRWASCSNAVQIYHRLTPLPGYTEKKRFFCSHATHTTPNPEEEGWWSR